MATPSAKMNSTYFVNPFVDWALIGGLSLLAFSILSTGPFAGARPRQEVGVVLLFLFNWPHFAATELRLYGSPRNRAQFPQTSWLSLLFCVGAGAAAISSPLLLAPLFLKAFLLWSPFHYSGQTLGLSLIYARRTQVAVGRWSRLCLAGFIYLSFLSQSAAAEVLPTGPAHYGLRVPAFNVPDWLPLSLRVAMWLCGGGYLAALAFAWVRSKRRPPLIVLLPALAQYVWFVPGAQIVGFRELVPIFHSVQYLLVAWAVQLSESSDINGLTPRAAAGTSVRWWLTVLALGGALFVILPRAVQLLGTDPQLTMAVVSACVQIHHFFVDGVIWKLRPRASTSPLLSNVSTLWRGSPVGPSEIQAA